MSGGAAIYVMSGTGNSLRVAAWVRDAVQQTGDEARILPIASRPSGDAAPDLTALVFPTHGFTTPWPVLRMAFRLPRGSGKHAVVIPTRAGTKIGPLFLPGLEGTAGYLVALILMIKGYCVRGVIGLDMPSNFMIAHPGFSEPAARAIIGRAQTKLGRFLEQVLTGQRRLHGPAPLLLGLVLLPVSIGYMLVGRFFLAKMMFASSACNGCGLCAERCPFGAVLMWGKAKPRPYWTFSCESCLRCMAWCPKQAVESGHSLGALLGFAVAFAASMGLLGCVACGASHWSVSLLVGYVRFLLAIWLAYLLVSVLLRIPPINRLFTLTTFVHFFRRYREPDTRLDDFDLGD